MDLDLPLPSSSMGDTRREPDSPPAPAPAPEDADVRWMISLCDTALRITGNLTDSVGAGVLDLRCSANSSIQSWRRTGGGGECPTLGQPWAAQGDAAQPGAVWHKRAWDKSSRRGIRSHSPALTRPRTANVHTGHWQGRRNRNTACNVNQIMCCIRPHPHLTHTYTHLRGRTIVGGRNGHEVPGDDRLGVHPCPCRQDPTGLDGHTTPCTCTSACPCTRP